MGGERTGWLPTLRCVGMRRLRGQLPPSGGELAYGVIRSVYVRNYEPTRPLLRPAPFER